MPEFDECKGAFDPAGQAACRAAKLRIQSLAMRSGPSYAFRT